MFGLFPQVTMNKDKVQLMGNEYKKHYRIVFNQKKEKEEEKNLCISHT